MGGNSTRIKPRSMGVSVTRQSRVCVRRRSENTGLRSVQGPGPAGDSRCRWALPAEGGERAGLQPGRATPPGRLNLGGRGRGGGGGSPASSPGPGGECPARAQAAARRTRRRLARPGFPDPGPEGGCPFTYARARSPPPCRSARPVGEPPPAHGLARAHPGYVGATSDPGHTRWGSPHAARLGTPLPPEVDFLQGPPIAACVTQRKHESHVASG